MRYSRTIPDRLAFRFSAIFRLWRGNRFRPVVTTREIGGIVREVAIRAVDMAHGGPIGVDVASKCCRTKCPFILSVDSKSRNSHTCHHQGLHPCSVRRLRFGHGPRADVIKNFSIRLSDFGRKGRMIAAFLANEGMQSLDFLRLCLNRVDDPLFLFL